MLTNSFLRYPLVKFCLILLLSMFIALAFGIMPSQQVLAQSDSAVRSDIVSLRSRVQRLEAEVSRLTQSIPRGNQPTSRNAGAIAQEGTASSDPMFDRLATLVIELKERVTDLEKRMAQVEQKNTPLNR